MRWMGIMAVELSWGKYVSSWKNDSKKLRAVNKEVRSAGKLAVSIVSLYSVNIC